MRTWMLSGLALGLLSFSLRAQDEPPRKLESPSTVPAGPAAPAADCNVVEKCKTSYQLHWLEREVPGVKTTPILKEVTTPSSRTLLEIDYNQCTRTKTEYVLKPRETIKEVTICTQKPKVVKDPCTGCSTVVFEPVTETKQVKEITYCLEAEEKTVTVRTPFLKEVEQPTVKKRLELEWKCEAVVRKERFGVLVPVEIKERKACPPPCPPLPCPPLP